MSCVDCGKDEGYTRLPDGHEICRACYTSRANDPLNKNYGRTGYGCCMPVATQANAQALHDRTHRNAVAAAGVHCDCDRHNGKPSPFVFP